MSNAPKSIIALDESVTYEIKASGHIQQDWSDWIEATMSFTDPKDGPPVSTIIGVFDQAALHGLLRRLYSQGFALICVNNVDEL